MSDEEVFKVGRVTTNLSVEVCTAIAETAIADDFQHSLSQFVVVDGELVSIPTILSITTVCVDRTKHTSVNGTSKFMLECMTSESSVVHLDINLEVLIKTMSFQETNNGFRIHIILVLRRLHWFWFNQERTLESLCTSIVASHSQHRSHVFFLTLLVGVQQAHITFTTAPEYIVGTTKFDSSINSVLDLNDSTSYNIEIRIGRSTISITLVAKYVSCTPKQLDVGELFHLLLSIVGNFLHTTLVLLDGLTFFNEVNIMEAEIFDTQFIHDFETSIHLILGALYGAFSLIPFIRTSLSTELVCTCSSECVPPCHGKLQPIFHLFAHHFALRLIIVERHYILAFFSFERNFSSK